jgi:S1-C subfamily serine protease
MYYGRHGLTRLSIPVHGIHFSRDVYANVSAGDVVEVGGLGKVIVSESTIHHLNEGGPTDLPDVQHPFYYHELGLIPGDLTERETDHQYTLGAALRLAPDVKPKLRLVLGPPAGFESATERAALLDRELAELTHRRMSDALLAKAIQATAFIECQYLRGTANAKTSGTGFFINPKGLIITNAHVVVPVLALDGRDFHLASIKVSAYPGTPEETTVDATVVRRSHNSDLALLDVGGWGWDFLSVDRTGQETHLASVVAIGYPGGRLLANPGKIPLPSVRAGQLTAWRGTRESTQYVEHSAPIEKGNSGGPLIK